MLSARALMILALLALVPCGEARAIGPYNSDLSEEMDRLTRSAASQIEEGFADFQLMIGAVERRDPETAERHRAAAAEKIEAAAAALEAAVKSASSQVLRPNPAQDERGLLDTIYQRFQKYDISRETTERQLLLRGVATVRALAQSLSRANPKQLSQNGRRLRALYQQYIDCQQFGLDIASYIGMSSRPL